MKKTLIALLFLLASVPAYSQTAQDEIDRFVHFYGAEVQRTGVAPDASSTRESRIAFLQQTVKAFCSPLLAMKRADPGRPISDEVVVYLKTGPEYRVFADFIVSGGSSGWKLSKHLEGRLPIAQPLVNPITLGLLQEPSFAPTVPGCVPPSPAPVPTPIPPPAVSQPYPDENAWWGGYYEPAVALLYFEAGRPFPDNSAAFRWFSRVAYLIGQGMTKEAAAAKQLAELRAALGLP